MASGEAHNPYSCVNDPNFTTICMFLERFSESFGIDKLNISQLSMMLEDNSSVSPILEDLHIKLLRKIKKMVPSGKWENTLAKFAHTYSSQDAWEIERFGYKNASVIVKMRILKALLEAQFDRNVKFKGHINTVAAKELRSEPVGRDKLGNMYWCIMDRYGNIRIFQENPDEESWRLVASNRDEVENLIHKLKMNDMDALAAPDVMDEDSSSNSASGNSGGKNGIKYETKEQPSAVKDINFVVEAQTSEEVLHKLEQNTTSITPLSVTKQEANKSLDDQETPLFISEPKIQCKIKDYHVTPILKKKTENTTKNGKDMHDHADKTVDEADKPILDENIPSTVEILSIDKTDKDRQIVKLENTSEIKMDDEVGQPIEEPVMTVKGEGSGAECETIPIFSDVISEPIFYVYGLGHGVDNDMGNIKKSKECNTNCNTKSTSPIEKAGAVTKETPEITSPSKAINLPLKKKINKDYSDHMNASVEKLGSIDNEPKSVLANNLVSKTENNTEDNSVINNSVEENCSNPNTTDLRSSPHTKPKHNDSELKPPSNKNNSKLLIKLDQANRSPGTNETAKLSESQDCSRTIIKNKKIDESTINQHRDSIHQEDVATKMSPNIMAKKNVKGKKTTVDGIDISQIIDSLESGPPVRQSRRIAQQKIREETNRRLIEEKMLREMKAEAIKKKKKSGIPASEDEDYIASEDEDDENSKSTESKIKKKKSDKPWMTSSSESSSESEPEEYYIEHEHSDGGRHSVKSDHEFSPESDLEDDCTVPTRRARTVRAERYDDSDDSIDSNEDHACQKCGQTDHPEWILLCDSCDKGYHCSCLVPVLFVIPEGDWFCPVCQQEMLIVNLQSRLAQYDEWYKLYEIEESQRLLQEKEKEENMRILEAAKKIKKQNEKADRNENDGKGDANGKKSKENSDSSSSSSDDHSTNSSDSDEDDIPIYKLRRRNQNNMSYRFNEYDALINSAITRRSPEEESDDGFVGGKDIRNIIAAEKEKENKQKIQPDIVLPAIEKKVAVKNRRKKKKLNNLDASSDEDDGSDEDFKGTSSDDEDEESYSASDVSESSLELGLSRKSRAAAKRRLDKRFINDDEDESDEGTYNIRKRAAKTKKILEDSDEFDEDDDITESEEIDSADLCSDTETDSSENNKKNRTKPRVVKNSLPKPSMNVNKRKKLKSDEDKSYKIGSKKSLPNPRSDSDSSDDDKVLSSISKRKTRGRKLHYILDDDFESSDDGITPGVHRPDTPPEERELFIKKQEEIKRMLAEKNAAAAKELATPKLNTTNDTIDKNKSTSLFNIPPQVIESAKVLDKDFLKSSRSLDSDDNDEDLDINFPDPDDVNEEELAKIMEDEDFAQHQLKLEDEDILRNKSVIDNSPRKKARDFESIDPTEITKSRNLGIEKLPKDALKLVLPTEVAQPIHSGERVIQDYGSVFSQVSNVPSLLQQMKQQAIPLPLNEPLLPLKITQPPTVLNSDQIFPSPSIINYPIVNKPPTTPVIEPSVETKDGVDVRRRRRKKITPLRNDLYRGMLNGPISLNPSKPIGYHIPPVPPISSSTALSENSSHPYPASKPSEPSVYSSNPSKSDHLESSRFSAQNPYVLTNYTPQPYGHVVANSTGMTPVEPTVLEEPQSRQSSPRTFTTLETVPHEESRADQPVESIERNRMETESNSEFSGLVSYFSSQQNELNA